MKINEMALENQPRERLKSKGAQALSNAELLAIILRSGSKRENVLTLSNKLLKKGLHNLALSSLIELQQNQGVGESKACQIKAVFELYKRLHDTATNTIISSSKDVAKIYIPKLKYEKKEHCIALYLDIKNNLIAAETISIGTINQAPLHPREVYHGALRNLATSIILLHNHPSGDPSPSKEDIEVTKRFIQAGKILHIGFLDHIIIGKNKWWSYKENKINFLKNN